jgi:hypothetical protein
MTGGDGVDRAWGGEGDDVIDGGAGNDAWLDGEGGNDTIQGGAGSDVISGGAGRDLLIGDEEGVSTTTARAGTTGTLTSANFCDFWGGVNVTARNITSTGALTSASSANVGIHADGIGASGNQASSPSIKQETGWSPTQNVSEQLIVDFGRDVTSAQASVSWFFASERGAMEQGRWTVLDNCNVVGTGLFTNTIGGSNYVVQINPGVAFDTIVFEATTYVNGAGQNA